MSHHDVVQVVYFAPKSSTDRLFC